MTLVAARTALIAVDLMPRIVELDMGPHLGADVVARTAELAAALRRAGGTVVLVRVERPNVTEQPPGSGLFPEMAPREGDIEVIKREVHDTGHLIAQL